ncbi:MAG: DNA repair protein RecO [Candidatus Zixiibacteriota bacterium]|nr:MAG: DNA repair protein RecO [candidate division Zixibacteria bacterium]
MSLEKSEAVLLKAHNWSESSRTVVFFASDFGRIALVDKGGRSLKSRRGRLLPFARLEITFYHSQRETRGYLREIDAIEVFSYEDEGGLGRLAYASAATELLNLVLPEEEHQAQLYDYFVVYLRQLSTVAKKSLAPVFIAFYLRLLSHLGYHPSLGYCVTCGKALAEFRKTGRRMFSPARGGVICETCQKAGDYYIGFSSEAYGRLLTLQTASLAEAALVPVRFAEASRFIEALTGLLTSQTGLKSELKSLEFIEKLKKSKWTTT